MRKLRTINLFLFSLLLIGTSWSVTYEGIALLNQTAIAAYFDNFFNYLYDSHGCLHFTPSDVYLLARTIPAGVELEIKSYADKQPPFDYKKTPFFADVTSSRQDMKYYADIFRDNRTNLLVYPGLERLFILVNRQPYLQMRVHPGPAKPFVQVFGVEAGKPINWDIDTMTPTDPGRYRILRSEEHYQSNLYNKTTFAPFGALIKHGGNSWAIQRKGKWYQVPQYVADDIDLPASERYFNYYDLQYDKNGRLSSLRWGSHDFGQDVILWTKDGRNRYPELGYAEGELLFDQVILIKDLAQMLTQSETNDYDACVAVNENFKTYRDLDEMIASKGTKVSANIHPDAALYYRYFYRLSLSDKEKTKLNNQISAAFAYPDKNTRARGLYNYVKDYVAVVEEKARWYRKLKKDWPFWQELKEKLQTDLEQSGVTDNSQRQAQVERWLNQRLYFQIITPR